MADPARLDHRFSALADASRRGLLDRLCRGPASASDLAGPLGIAMPSAVKHLAALERSGFVVSNKVGRVRTYRVEAKAFDSMAAWLAARKKLVQAQSRRR